MLGRRSEEGNEEGLGLIPFETVRFQLEDRKDLKTPHMGWDIVSMELNDDPVLQGLVGLQRYYFVHSYHAECENEENVLMRCEYGYSFPAAVKNEKIYGFQFHPEKAINLGWHYWRISLGEFNMYYRPRLIPCLTMINRGLVKTTKFNNPRYIGDPINTVKIFNGKV